MPKNPEVHLSETGRRLELQTDKERTKIIPCTHAGCDTDVEVTTFYAPYKAKCAAHGEKKASAIATSHLIHQSSEGAVPNGSLANLECPLCKNTMTIVQVHDDGGFITFRCTDGFGYPLKEVIRRSESGPRFCGTSVQVRPHWGAMEMTSIPPKWAQLVEDFNINAKMEYFDKKHSEEVG